MSADYVVVFYGAQIALSAYDVRACESQSHPLMKSARNANLDAHWADFISANGHAYQLLIGRRFGSFGFEDSLETHIEKGTITQTMAEVDAFLVRVGLSSPGKLIVRYHQEP